MKGKAIIPLLLGLGVGFVTVKLAVDAIRKAQAANQSVPTVKAVRAKQDIEPFTRITQEMVEEVETADSAFAPKLDRIEDVKEVLGRVTAKSIPDKAAVLKSMLAPEGTPAGLQGQIPPGYRAVSVKIDEVTGVAYQLKPGDWVDVIVVMDIATGMRGHKETIAEVILQHVQVAAIGHDTNPQQPDSSSKVKPAKSATILVREEDVPKLHLAATRGKVTLAMRGKDDVNRDPPPSAKLGDVIAMLGHALEPDKKTNEPDGNQPIPPVPGPSPNRAEREVPYTVLVVHGNAGSKEPTTFEMLTFEDKESLNVIKASQGLTHPRSQSEGDDEAMGGLEPFRNRSRQRSAQPQPSENRFEFRDANENSDE